MSSFRSASGFKAMKRRAWLGAPPDWPVKLPTLATAGSLSRTRMRSCTRWLMAWNETVVGASAMATMVPVSCWGKNPFGTSIQRTAVATMVATITPSVRPRWRSTAEMGSHDGDQGERDDGGDGDGKRHSDGELPKQSPDYAAHE